MNFAMFVLDSVLFDSRHRQNLVAQYQNHEDPSQRGMHWADYWDQCVNDVPLPALQVAAAMLNAGSHLVLTSGRPASMLDVTRAKVEAALAEVGADPTLFPNIRYDLRASGEHYLDKVGQLITQLQEADGELVLALIKNNGLASQLRRAWPLATICTVSRDRRTS